VYGEDSRGASWLVVAQIDDYGRGAHKSYMLGRDEGAGAWLQTVFDVCQVKSLSVIKKMMIKGSNFKIFLSH
jgi:hypothetical protein